jgi:hypothetical protein
MTAQNYAAKMQMQRLPARLIASILGLLGVVGLPLAAVLMILADGHRLVR